MAETISIPGRFNGPLESGNGGYCAGIAANLLGAAADVSIRRPVPLDSPLGVERDDDALRVVDGDEVVLEAAMGGEIDAEVPAPVSLDQAREASARWRRPDDLFSHCFVCGRAREDGFGLFAGEVEGRRAVAAPWTAPSGPLARTATCGPNSSGPCSTARTSSPSTSGRTCG